MKKLQFIFLFMFQCLWLSSALWANEDICVPNQLILEFEPFVNEQKDELKKELSANILNIYDEVGMEHWELADPDRTLEEAILYCKSKSYVKTVDCNYLYQLASDPPNDAHFDSLWNIYDASPANADINCLEAWEIQQDVEPVVVAVLDTGVDWTHEDLQESMWRNPNEIPNDGIDNDCNGFVDDYYGYDFFTNDSDPMDTHIDYHGTHVAGIIAATKNNGVGVAGVTDKVKIMALKIFDKNKSAETSNIIAAIDYSLKMKVPISNNSWGNYESITEEKAVALFSAIQKAGEKGQLFIAAAGNNGWDNDSNNPFYPASYDLDNIISVTSTNRQGQVVESHNYGQYSVDLAAPGDLIYSTNSSHIDKYKRESGTSMATPHVTGVAALLLAHRPSLSFDKLKSLLLNTVEKESSLASKTVTGGKLDAYAALKSATENVYPGDVNQDGKVNMVDFLGLYFAHGQTGPARADQATDFSPKPTENWTTSFTEDRFAGINHKHADCNGDGVVNWSDTLVIQQNMNATLNATQPASDLGPIKMDLVTEKEITSTEEYYSVTSDTKLRRRNTTMQFPRSMVFSLKYYHTADTLWAEFSDELGVYGQDFLATYTHDSVGKMVDIGITRLSNNVQFNNNDELPLIRLNHSVIVDNVPVNDSPTVNGANPIFLTTTGEEISMAAQSENENNRIYVNQSATGNNDGTSWIDAFTNLQDALEKVEVYPELQEIWVAEGTYYPSKIVDIDGDGDFEEREKTFHLINNTKVYGGFKGTEINLEQRDLENNLTILSGNIGILSTDDDNVFHVVYNSPTNVTSLDGFTIAGGYANSSSGSNRTGGGFYNAGEINLSNCTFNDNAANAGGGLINTYKATLTNCHFFNNTVLFLANYNNSGGGLLNLGGTSSQLLLQACTFKANKAINDGGGLADFSSGYSINLVNCLFENNEATDEGGGVYSDQGINSLTNCVFVNNTARIGGAIAYEELLGERKINNCSFINNQAMDAGGGIYHDLGNLCNIYNSLFWRNTTNGTISSIATNNQSTIALYACLLEEPTCPSNSSCDANTIFGQDPLFVNDQNGNFHLQATSPAINAGKNVFLPQDTYDLNGNGDTTECIPYDFNGGDRRREERVDIGAFESNSCMSVHNIVYVDRSATGDNTGTSWTNAFVDLQSALEQAESCSDFKEIWVAQGTYKPSKSADVGNNGELEEREKTFQLVNGVKLFGGFIGIETSIEDRNHGSNLTILSGDFNGDDVVNSSGFNNYDENAFHVVYTTGVSSATLLDGFIISGGNANGDEFNNTGGGGIFNNSGSSPIIKNCTISLNKGYLIGGGIANINASPKIFNSRFINNWRSIGNTGGDNSKFATVVNCVFSSSLPFGSEAVYSQGNSKIKIFNSTFLEGASNAIVIGNRSICNLVNCTFINYTSAALKRISTSKYNIQNCIFWGNGKSLDGYIKVSNSLLQESTCPDNVTCDENTILGQDPLFVDVENNDFRLQENSPAINTGNNDYLPTDEFDLDGDNNTTEIIPYDLNHNARIQGNVVDMGAYESNIEFTTITSQFRVFLSGPYNTTTNSMNTTLYNNQLLPLNQPYNQSPWNYNGTENVANFSDIPNNTVDWILVEIRDQNQNVVEQKAGFLLNDGSIVATDLNINGLAFENLTVGNQYYVVIRHRNHLPVMSANLLTVNNNGSLVYDFTTGTTQAWKNSNLPNEPMKVQNGISLLWGGNANSNQNVSYSGGSNDRTAVLVALGFDKSAVIQGYHTEDVNMDGNVKYSGGSNDRTTILAQLSFDKSKVITAHLP